MQITGYDNIPKTLHFFMDSKILTHICLIINVTLREKVPSSQKKPDFVANQRNSVKINALKKKRKFR